MVQRGYKVKFVTASALVEALLAKEEHRLLSMEKQWLKYDVVICDELGCAPFLDIARVLGKHLNLPAVSISREEADAHFGFLGVVASVDIPSRLPGSSGEQTRELLGGVLCTPGSPRTKNTNYISGL